MSHNLEHKMSQGNEEFVFTWTIENYFLCVSKNKDKFYSPDFKADNICETIWSVILYPRGHENFVDFVSLGLVYGYDETGEKMTMNFKIELCNAKDEVFVSVEKNEVVFEESREYLILNFISVQELEKKIKNSAKDNLVVRFRMCLPKSATTESPSTMSCTAKTEISFDSFSFLRNVFCTSPNWSATETFLINNENELLISFQVPNDDFLIEIVTVNKIFSLFSVKCEIVYLNDEGREICSNCDSFTFENTTNEWIFPRFLKKSFLNKDLNTESLLFKFNFLISNEIVLNRFIENTMEPNLPSSSMISLAGDFREMLFSKDISDVSFRIDGEIISAHKFVLASRSPVFSAMFHQKMVESQSGVIDISDFDVQTLKLFLEFLYTGDVEVLELERALALLLIAEKYQVPSLKERCSKMLKSSLSTDNVCDVVSVADMVGHQTLKAAAIEYVKDNSTEVLGSNTWLKWIKQNVELSSEILYSLSQEFKTIRKKI